MTGSSSDFSSRTYASVAVPRELAFGASSRGSVCAWGDDYIILVAHAARRERSVKCFSRCEIEISYFLVFEPLLRLPNATDAYMHASPIARRLFRWRGVSRRCNLYERVGPRSHPDSTRVQNRNPETCLFDARPRASTLLRFQLLYGRCAVLVAVLRSSMFCSQVVRVCE